MKVITLIVIGMVLVFGWTAPVAAQQSNPPGPVALPQISIGLGPVTTNAQITTGVQIMLLITVLALVPSLLIMLTSFTRIAVVLSFVRQALGTHTIPTNQIVLGLSVFLTVFIMFPVWTQIHQEAIKPFMTQEIGYEEAISKALQPLRSFMLKQTREKDLGLFLKIGQRAKPQTIVEVPTWVIIPAFVISELKTAFLIGFLIWMPFLIIDMVIASVLMSMGMMMLPPIMISLPFKLLIFVLADGWYLLIGSLVNSFAT